MNTSPKDNPSNTFSKEWLEFSINELIGIVQYTHSFKDEPDKKARQVERNKQAKARFKAAILKRHKEELLAAQIKIVANILVYQATGKKRVGLSRAGVVNVLAELQAERAELWDKRGEQLQASNNTETPE